MIVHLEKTQPLELAPVKQILTTGYGLDEQRVKRRLLLDVGCGEDHKPRPRAFLVTDIVWTF